MKRIITSAFAIFTAFSLASCAAAAQPSETVTEETAPVSETSIEETVPETAESEMVIFTTVETETVIQDYVQSKDLESWFNQIRGTWEPADSGLSDQDRVGTALYELADGEIVDDMIFDASVGECSALRAQGPVYAEVTGSSIYKMSGDSSGDDSSFYGKNAAVQSLDGAFLKLTNCQINAAAENATGVFAYNDALIFIADSKVDISGGGAGGIQVAGGGKLYGWNLTVNSESKAAIRSDRGGGIMEIEGGSYTSNGQNGCPAVYSTADITVRNAELTSNHSRAVIIEGKNSVTLENCSASGHDESSKEGSIKGNVLLYQSASGDAGEGTSVFTMDGGSMKAGTGVMFYCTNTASVINISNVGFEYSDEGGFLQVSKGRWGREGSNGGDCVLNAKEQKIDGDITVDDISSLELNMEKSEFNGAVNPDGEAGYVKVVMDEGSVWNLTGDSYVTEFEGNLENVDTGSFHLYVNGEIKK